MVVRGLELNDHVPLCFVVTDPRNDDALANRCAGERVQCHCTVVLHLNRLGRCELAYEEQRLKNDGFQSALPFPELISWLPAP